jgi:hypothetical protein
MQAQSLNIIIIIIIIVIIIIITTYNPSLGLGRFLF